MDSRNLAASKCVPCAGGIAPLTSGQARELSAQTPGWKLSGDAARISREFRFEDFVAAMKFVNAVAGLAEEQGHHPDIEIHWNRVTLTLWTHSIGGLHENDFIVAAKIDGL